MATRRETQSAALSPPTSSDDLRRLRRRLGLTQAQLAITLGLSLRALKNYEAGTRPVPRPVALACLAIAAGLVDVAPPPPAPVGAVKPAD